jgi:hypothetical protein
MVPWITATEIQTKIMSPNYSKRRLHNEVYGLAYGGDDIPITMAMLEACMENDERLGRTSTELYVGIDWGAPSYMIIQEPFEDGFKLVDLEIAGDADPRQHAHKFARYMGKYAQYIKRVVCDAGPDTSRAFELIDECRKLGIKNVWACYYTSPPAKTTITWHDLNDTDSKKTDSVLNNAKYVTVGRTEIIDRVVDEIYDERFVIPGSNKNNDKIVTMCEHMTNIAAIRNKNISGNEFIQYQDTGPDHFLHAKVYATIAASTAEAIVLSGVAPKIQTPSHNIDSIGRRSSDPFDRPRVGAVAGTRFPTFQRPPRRSR